MKSSHGVIAQPRWMSIDLVIDMFGQNAQDHYPSNVKFGNWFFLSSHRPGTIAVQGHTKFREIAPITKVIYSTMVVDGVESGDTM